MIIAILEIYHEFWRTQFAYFADILRI